MHVYKNNLTHIDPWPDCRCQHKERQQECPSVSLTSLTHGTHSCVVMKQQRGMRSKPKIRGTSWIPNGTSIKSVCSYFYQRLQQSGGVIFTQFHICNQFNVHFHKQDLFFPFHWLFPFLRSFHKRFGWGEVCRSGCPGVTLSSLTAEGSHVQAAWFGLWATNQALAAYVLDWLNSALLLIQDDDKLLWRNGQGDMLFIPKTTTKPEKQQQNKLKLLGGIM